MGIPILRRTKSLASYNPVPYGCVFFAPLFHSSCRGSVFVSADPYRTVVTRIGGVMNGAGFTGDGDDYFSLSNEALFDIDYLSPQSIVAQIKTNTASKEIVGKWDTVKGQQLIVDGNSKLSFTQTIEAGLLRTSVSGGTTITGSVNKLVGCSYTGSGDAAGVTLYVNAVAETPTVNDDDLNASILNNTAVNIGARNAGDSLHFVGSIGFVAIYNRSLSLGEHQAWNRARLIWGL